MSDISKKIANLNIVKKIKNIKHIEFIILGIFICVIVLIFLSTTSFKASSKTSESIDYSTFLENKLEKVLSNINGAGDVSVMVTVDSSAELIIATSKEEKTTSSSSSNSESSNTTTVETPILITENGVTSPLVLQEIMPDVLGVIVVAQGANDAKIRLELLKAVQSVLNIEISCIEIFVHK